jgi:A/G-specific adenine glycosylase
VVPEEIEKLHALPGIGRSTAGAILALSRGQRHPVLDGNARRVLARYFAVEGPSAAPDALRRLWQLADACTPRLRVAAYTQAIMDLGATLCTRSQPRCEDCPLQGGCVARLTGRQAHLPATRTRRAKRRRSASALIVRREDGAVLLQQRPDTGLWGGLWTFPQFDSEHEALEWAQQQCGSAAQIHRLAPYAHSFTHFDLTLHPVVIDAKATTPAPAGCTWFDVDNPPRIGVTKPVTALLEKLAAGTTGSAGLRPDETDVVCGARCKESHEVVSFGLNL